MECLDMLSFCDPRGRREFLKIGSLALGGLTLPGWIATRALGSSKVAQKPCIRVRSATKR